MSALHGILYDQDGILCKQSYQHDQSDLDINVILKPRKADKSKYAQDTGGYREYYSQRQDITFVLCSQQEKYKQHAQHEHKHCLVARLDLFSCYAGEFISISFW